MGSGFVGYFAFAFSVPRALVCYIFYQKTNENHVRKNFRLVGCTILGTSYKPMLQTINMFKKVCQTAVMRRNNQAGILLFCLCQN